MSRLQKNYKNLISQFNRSSVFFLNLKRSLIFIALPSIVLNIFASFYYYKNVTSEAKIASERVFDSVAGRAEDIYEEAENLFSTLMLESGIDIFLKTDDVVSLSANALTVVQNPLKIAKTHCTLSSNIESVDIYSKRAGYVLSTYNSSRYENFSDKPWYNASSDNLCFVVKDKNSFSLCYNLIDNMQSAGLMVFNIKSDIFSDISLKNCTLQLVTEDGNAFFAYGDSNAIRPELKNEKYIKQSAHYTRMVSPMSNNTYLYIEIKHDRSIYSAFIWTLVLTLTTTLISSMVLSYILSSHNYKIINDIAMNINDTEPEHPFEDSTNEIMYINQNIIRMKSKNQHLEKELLESMVALKRLQTQVLQIQFTPHFIFNALNALNTSLMINHGPDNPESETVLILSRLLSQSIDVQHYLVTVEQEIAYSKEYLKIQNLLSDKSFDVEWDVDSDIKESIVVKFSLQPIIENAFKHGIKQLHNKTRGLLKIYAKKKDEKIIFRILNNGPLPDRQTIINLNDMLRSSIGSKGKHVGLFNTNKRIKLVFGDEYGCHIGTCEGLTEVTLTIPDVTDFEMNKN